MFHEPDCEKLLKKNCQNHHLGLPASNCAFPSILYTKSTSSMKTNQNWNDFAVCSIKFEGGSKRNGWKCRRQDNVRNGVLNGVDIKRKLPIRPAPTSESQVSRRRCCPYASSTSSTSSEGLRPKPTASTESACESPPHTYQNIETNLVYLFVFIPNYEHATTALKYHLRRWTRQQNVRRIECRFHGMDRQRKHEHDVSELLLLLFLFPSFWWLLSWWHWRSSRRRDSEGIRNCWQLSGDG